MTAIPDPTERELAILKVLWDHGDRSVREVYEILREDLPIVQNTVQAFLRTMEEKGLVQHRVEGRTFIYSAVPRRDAIPGLVEPPLVAILAEGPLVVMALVETLPRPDGDGSYTSTHFNLFRVEEGRLAEHWHSVQTPPGPEVARPEDGGPQPVTGLSGSDQYALLGAAQPELAANKRLVFDAWRQIVDAGREELTELYFAPDFVSHNPNAPTGRAGFAVQFGDGPDRPIGAALRDPLVAVVAEGDRVALVRAQTHPHPVRAGASYTTTAFDLFRIADGRIVEHWDAGVLATSARCPADGELGYICGLSNAEDVVRLGTSRWLVASSITRRVDAVATGQLYLIDAVQKTAAELFPGTAPVLAPDTAMFGDC